jgi:adenylate cyclase
MKSSLLEAPVRSELDEALDHPAARPVVEIYKWATELGLRGASAETIFDGYCRNLVVNGIRLLRGHVSTPTLHPQWAGYGYTWRRKTNALNVQVFLRGDTPSEMWLTSPFFNLIDRAQRGERDPQLRRRLEQGPEQRDFPALIEFHAEGATDYFAAISVFGENGDPAQGKGVVYSFTTDAPGGFRDPEIELIQMTLPAVSLALKAHAGHQIATNLLRTYLGDHTASRVHSGSVQRGATEALRAALFYADVRGFTKLTDVTPADQIIDMLDDIFETLIAPMRTRGGHVLKFIGDAVLAIFPFEDGDEAYTCRAALDAAEEAIEALEKRRLERMEAGVPFASVDIALHVGELMYGNFGAVDRLDFTAIGPAVNEVARLEKLCEPLGRKLLMSERFARAAVTCSGRLKALGSFNLRGVSEPKEVFGCAKELSDPVAS